MENRLSPTGHGLPCSSNIGPPPPERTFLGCPSVSQSSLDFLPGPKKNEKSCGKKKDFPI